MRHTFYFGRSHAHRAYLLTRQEVCIVGYRDGFTTAVRKIWSAFNRAVAKSKQKRLDRELALRGVRNPDKPTPQVPAVLSEKWDF
ncbi:MAG: hypothetical protein J0I29_13045 [Rhizobiales bacterium]|nr:hypothetical protein [Hyphomicrobiales bacterium]